MLAKTHTNPLFTLYFLGVLVFSLLFMGLLPGKASAQSYTFALACHPNAAIVAVTKDRLSCEGGSAPNESVYVAARGSDGSKYPKHIALTIVSVDCGSSQLIGGYATGNDISRFDCKKGDAKVTVKRTLDANGKKIDNVKSAGKNSSNSCVSGSCEDEAIDGCKSNDDRCDFIGRYINPDINLLTAAFGIIAVISLIVGAVQYSTSAGDPQKASQAKKRILNTVVAILAYFFLYGFLQFLIPGGLFN